MSIEPPTPETRRIIAAAGGGFLRNTVRLDGRTCAVCTTPIRPSFRVCYQCRQHQQSGQHLADGVVPLVYAVANAQSGWLMHNYKGVAPGPTDRPRLKLLLALALTLHRRCVEGAAGEPISVWTTLPSTRGRSGGHPIQDVARSAEPAPTEVLLLPGPEFAAPSREFASRRWQVERPELVAGRHVLIVDDTWTTGAKIQSAATALRAAGASATTILVLARWLEPGFGDNESFIKSCLTVDYDPFRCPVTGGTCPT